MKNNFEPGDQVVCTKECIMNTGAKTTTIGKTYTILPCTIEDKIYIIDDENDPHYFTKSWYKYFRIARKDKLLKLKTISDQNE